MNLSEHQRLYAEDEMLMLSGVQHYVFCPRQWALIQIEQIWADNQLTAEGVSLHHNVDNPSYRKVNNGKLTYRRVHLASHRLGLYGISDAIEMVPVETEHNAIQLPGRPGYYIPMPVEYKHGHSKKDLCDIMQVVCQAMCLEEMYDIEINIGAIFYWETMSRDVVDITDSLRQQAYDISSQMHQIYSCGKLPKANDVKKCHRCSLKDLCLPQITINASTSNYLSLLSNEETA